MLRGNRRKSAEREEISSSESWPFLHLFQSTFPTSAQSRSGAHNSYPPPSNRSAASECSSGRSHLTATLASTTTSLNDLCPPGSDRRYPPKSAPPTAVAIARRCAGLHPSRGGR